MPSRKKMGKCIACGRPVEWENWAAGPVCYPCYWGAKLLYESGIDKVADIPPALVPMLESLFLKGGYNWPTDLTWALINRPFDKADTMLRRWWSPTKEQEAKDYQEDT
ncbi:MAG: hypothetical protein PHI12_06605 [Dehalococcoidales bacterium]|nr:hypothetical protein [Dehalococcoidales bacterium]